MMVPAWIVVFVIPPLALLTICAFFQMQRAIRCLQFCYWEQRMRLLDANLAALHAANDGDAKLGYDLFREELESLDRRHSRMAKDVALKPPNAEHAYYPAEIFHGVRPLPL